MSKRFISMLAALVALATGLTIAAPTASARSAVVATYRLSPGGYDLATGLGAVWALNGDEYHYGKLYRIDPVTGRMTVAAKLSFPAGGIAIADNSIWISDYFGNAVWRFSPTGAVQAEIGVGLQPQWLHAAFGSVWASNHHGASVSRIDPATNTVVATAPAGAPGVFRDGPQAMTDDGKKLYVLSSNQQALQAVDPSTNTTTTFASTQDAGCGPLTAIAGFVWSADGCTGAFYQLATDGTVEHVLPSTGAPGGVTTLGSQFWISNDTTFDPDTGAGTGAVVEKLDPVSGAVLRTISLGGDALDLVGAFNDLWVYDSVANTIRRVHV